MENMQDMTNIITNTSVTIAVIAYFIFRDYKFMSQLHNTLASLVNTVDTLKEIIKERNSYEHTDHSED